MGSIVLLDEHTVNKIAAGEVVDRPSSIVKELVENSIDAKATSITIDIKNGGIGYIKITDNGVGFMSDDIELAFERHATSKIRKEEDLLKITSMGFRGEALASIAAISKVVLTSKNENEKVGVKVHVEAGKTISVEETATVTGTKIEISDVFFNVPARFKFLKKDYTEAGYIEDVVTRIALSNPHISFKLINNSKVILQTSGNTDINTAIFDIFGKDIYENIIPISYEKNSIKISGVIGLPKISRSTRMHQFTYLNTRYIKDKTINSAIDKACQQKFAINKYPFLVINIKMNPSHIDVNVHPAKLEVKFEDESTVFQTVYSAILYALDENNKKTSPFYNIRDEINQEMLSNISKDLVNNGVIKEEGSKYNIDDKKFDFNNNFKDDFTKTNSENIENNTKPNNNIELLEKNKPVFTPYEEIKTNSNLLVNLENELNTIATNNIEEVTNINPVQNVDNPHINSSLSVDKEIIYKFIGNVFDTYIIIQIKDKMYIIDQHAAHERLLFEQFKKKFYSKDKESQILLIPILVELSNKEKDIVNQNVLMFENSGFIIEDFGDNAIKISGVPNIGYEIEYKSMFKDIIDELFGATKTEKSEKEFRFLATLACKAAVKGNMRLSQKEQISLIDDMVKLDNPFTCPHGRPTAYELSKYEIERRFLRK